MKPRRYRTREALEAALTSGAFDGKAMHLVVLHDDHRGCSPTSCRCSPEYVLEELTVESYQRGQRGEAAWRRRAAS